MKQYHSIRSEWPEPRITGDLPGLPDVPDMPHTTTRPLPLPPRKVPAMNPPVKPGAKTTEFFLTAITVIGSILVSTGVLAPEESSALVQAIGSVAAAVASVGYAVARTRAKLGF